jgi:haloacetate dehalogenase
MLGDRDAFWIAAERMGIKIGDDRFPQETVDAYRSQLDDPDSVTAMCEDYRAGATVDRAHDDADRGTRTIACPVRALWGAQGALPHLYDDPLEPWRVYAPAVTGHAVDGAGHFIPEDAPDDVAADLEAFFGDVARRFPN